MIAITAIGSHNKYLCNCLIFIYKGAKYLFDYQLFALVLWLLIPNWGSRITKISNKMEHKEQTGHVCRWIFCITIVTFVVGCTIVIGLFEWRDRSRMESRITETHLWRKAYITWTCVSPNRSYLVRQWKNIDRHIIVRFLINTAIQCNKFNIQSFFRYNIKAK